MYYMDITRLPRPLISREFFAIEDYYNRNFINPVVIKNMSSLVPFVNLGVFPTIALKCLNCAYYICTLIKIHKQPILWSARYKELATCGDEKDTITQTVVISLVAIFLEHSADEELRSHAKELLEDFHNFIRRATIDPVFYTEEGDEGDEPLTLSYTYNFLRAGTENLPLLQHDEFARRVVDNMAVNEVMAMNYSWKEFTHTYNVFEVKDLILFFNRTEEECLLVIDLLVNEIRLYYKDEPWASYMLGYLGLFRDVDHPELPAQLSLPGYRIKEEDPDVVIDSLRGKNEMLNARVGQLEKENDELTTKLTEITKERDDLKSLSEQLREDETLHDPVNKWAKIIFFATVLSTSYDAAYTNQKSLSELICFICGGKTSTYQPRISDLSKMQNSGIDSSGENYSHDVIESAKTLVDLLKKIPKRGFTDSSRISNYIDSIKSEFCLDKH